MLRKLSAADGSFCLWLMGGFAHPKLSIQSIANEFAMFCLYSLLLF